MDILTLTQNNPVLVHAFNSDKTQLALSPNNHEVHIFTKTSQNNWTLSHILCEHDKLVTGIDWAPKTNRIVTCSQDRNAYVWTFETSSQTWKPTLVNLRINRAATFVRWSPLEDKFAVASGARLICICYFEEDNNWWVSKHLKKPIKSTVLSVDWHPNNVYLVAGSSDKKVRVFSAFIKGVDKKISPTVWGDQTLFGTVLGEYASDYSGWIHSVAFSPSGNSIAFAAHDSTLTLISPSQNVNATTKMSTLPLMSITFISETQVLGVGCDCCPYVFQLNGNTIESGVNIDKGQKKTSTGNSAMDKFRQLDSRAQATSADIELATVHQNTITCVRSFAESAGQVSKVSTSGVDGKIVIWDLLTTGIQGLRIR